MTGRTGCPRGPRSQASSAIGLGCQCCARRHCKSKIDETLLSETRRRRGEEDRLVDDVEDGVRLGLVEALDADRHGPVGVDGFEARNRDGPHERVPAEDVLGRARRVVPVLVGVRRAVDAREAVDQGAELGRELVVGRVATGPDWAGRER